jgi:serine/threonine protein kinase
MSEETFNVILSDKDNFLFTSVDKVLKVKLKETIKSGKSGDSVFKIKCDDKDCILKIFKKNQKREKDEINSHLKFSTFYKDSEYKPFPIMYYYGSLYGEFANNKLNDRLYIIMEMVESFELDDYISLICKEKVKANHLELLNIILQLFYIIGIAQYNSLSHCDLHTKNIMLVKNNKKIKISLFDVIGENRHIEIGSYIVKIIDFGLASHLCEKIRTTSQTLNSLKFLCGSYPNLIELLKGELGLDIEYKNVDINFFCRIIEIMMLFDKELEEIDILYLWRQSINMYKIDSSKMNESSKKRYKQKLFRRMYYEITDHN